jgi:hypothetical protein
MVKYGKVSEQRDFVKALYYGHGGTGKTTALASLGNLGRVLFIDAESGLKAQPLRALGVNVDNIEVLALDGGLSYQGLDDAFWQIKRDLDDDPDSWTGVLWDSGTEIYQALLEEIVTARIERATQVARSRGKTSVSAAMLDRFFVDRDDYGENVRKVRLLMRHFRDLPCHFGSAFLERRDQDDKTHQVWVGPAISPGLQTDMVGWHDVVGRTTYDEATGAYLGTFRPEGVRQGKDRYGLLPPLLANPTMDRLVAYVSGELTATDDPRQRVLEGAREQEEPSGSDGEQESPTALARARAAARTAQGAGKGK